MKVPTPFLIITQSHILAMLGQDILHAHALQGAACQQLIFLAGLGRSCNPRVAGGLQLSHCEVEEH